MKSNRIIQKYHLKFSSEKKIIFLVASFKWYWLLVSKKYTTVIFDIEKSNGKSVVHLKTFYFLTNLLIWKTYLKKIYLIQKWKTFNALVAETKFIIQTYLIKNLKKFN